MAVFGPSIPAVVKYIVQDDVTVTHDLASNGRMIGDSVISICKSAHESLAPGLA